jgi:uncharacterized protein with PIN domain
MICPDCNGILFVKQVEEIPDAVKVKVNYDRLCDVECIKCNKVIYSQPYDNGRKINLVRDMCKE